MIQKNSGLLKNFRITLLPCYRSFCLSGFAISKATRDKDFQSHLKIHDCPISYEVLVNAMIQLSYIVEEKIAKEMKGNRGPILHDGW